MRAPRIARGRSPPASARTWPSPSRPRACCARSRRLLSRRRLADAALLHLVQERLVAHLQVLGGLASIPPKPLECVLDRFLLRTHRRMTRQLLEVDAVGATDRIEG